ncbi:MAG TPA: cytochrome P450 [Ktedonosporobacter sp.]|jgi:cytochrome P450|nr:cytochrome P450 [Ktedonosporobacter sp.]
MAKKSTAKLPPGPKPQPFFGNILQFRQDQTAYLQDLQRTYGDLATIYVGRRPSILVSHPDYIRYILTEHPRDFSSVQTRSDLKEVLGEGLLTIEGETHRQQRRMVQPAFHRKRVESYAEDMVRFSQDLLEEWHEGEEVDISQAMQELTLRIVVKSLFSLELASQVRELGYLFTQMAEHRRKILAQLLNIYIDAPFTEYGKRMGARRGIDKFIYQLIDQRRAEGRDTGDILSMLLVAQDEGDALTNEQVRDHVMTFIGAGHETTANTLTWTFLLLSENPGPREKLIREVQTILTGRAPTVNDLPNLPYTEWVINEAMRLYPPAWVIGRHALKDFDMGGYHFPAGTSFMLSQWVTHHLPEIWGDADVFRPERWDPVNGQKVPQWAYFPFGGGPRICIGMPFAQMEAKLLLATLIQRYSPRLAPGFQVELQPMVTLRAKHGLRMILDPTPTVVKDTVEA